MTDYPIKAEDILRATNGGLDIILHYFPQAQVCVTDNRRKFKVRDDEKTASATLREVEGGVWIVTDFGGDQKPRNGILVCQQQEGNTSYGEAIKLLAGRYNLTTDFVVPQAAKPKMDTRKADAEAADWYNIDKNSSFTDAELEIIFSEQILKDKNCGYKELAGVCYRYLFYPVKSYSYFKDGYIKTKSSTEEYPIFVFDHKDWQKIYEPKADKKYRFRYFGNKPKEFIHGLDVCRKAFEKIQKAAEEDFEEESAEGGQKKKVNKLPEIILCTGGSDALNVAALGYQVIWMNSESVKVTGTQYSEIARLTESFINLPDLDKTGREKAHELAMIYLDLRTINLPEDLLERRDPRGFPCKDVRDYFRYNGRRKFSELVANALPYRFWDEEYKRDSKGEVIIRYNRKIADYKPNNVQLYNFLKQNGFYRYKAESEKSGWLYIKVEGNIIRVIDANEIKNYIHAFLAERGFGVDLRNAFYRSTQLSEASLTNLTYIEIDFTDFDQDSQYLFFANKTWRVTAAGIEDFNPGNVQKFVWEDEVIKHRVDKLPDMFSVKYNEVLDDYDIEILNQDCLFFKFLINTSRLHWRKDLETGLSGHTFAEQQAYRVKHQFDINGPNLTDEEQKEQRLHLLNKIYVLGYYLHRYKQPSKSWCAFDMDARVSDDGLSYGRTGKSIASKALRFFMRTVTLDGRDPNLTKNPHVLENVTEHTDYLLVDDAAKYTDFSFFYSKITGETTINPKGKKSTELSAEVSPKIRISSNYTPSDLSPSTLDRLLFSVFSDYYHSNGTGDYNEVRSPRDDFGKDLFKDFTEKEWNLFINFCAQCCRTFMQYGKINPPMDNVNQRNQINEMGANFLNWADIYFSEESGNLDRMISRKLAFDDFLQQSKTTGWTTNTFSKKIKAWCNYRGYNLDPKELQNGKGRIIRKCYEHVWNRSMSRWEPIGDKKTTEMIYLQSPNKPITPETEEPEEPEEKYNTTVLPQTEVKF